MNFVTRSCTLPSELKAQVVEYLDARRDLAAVIQAHSSFKYFAEKRLYHYVDISDKCPYRSTLCLQVVTSRPSDIATYVEAVIVEMYSGFAKWPHMKALLVKALSMMRNATRIKFHAYRGSEAVLADCCIDRLEAYSGRALLSGQQLDYLSRNAPGLVKLDLGQSPLVPGKCPVYLDLHPRHRKTLRHLRINLVYTSNRTSDKLQLLELLSSFKQLVWFSFTSVGEETLEEDREFVVDIHRACPTLREIDLTQNRGPWRYLEKEKRWILRAESVGTIWRLDWVPKNSVWEEAQVENPLDRDYTYLRPLSSAEWRKRHENRLQTSKPPA
ncbi:hypothetical protein FRC00_004947 [Tulasnella sp. 408]|nr:hypothetical protein FRC00_004947 [Tulasnella sp. 408]